LALEAYRSELLTTAELRQLLGYETGYVLDGFLKEYGIYLEYTPRGAGARGREQLASFAAPTVGIASGGSKAPDRMIVISDSSPLNYLILIGQADLLQKLYSQVLTGGARMRPGRESNSCH
jgi:hypothetical protein